MCRTLGKFVKSKPNNNVKLQLIPACSSASPAWIPSQVEANLIKTRSLLTPDSSYSLINFLPLATIASLLKDKRASTSVEMRPGTTLEISIPSGDSQGKTTQSSVPKMVIVYFDIFFFLYDVFIFLL